LDNYAEIENRAGISRITCGWKKPELPLDFVRRYWRDVHSPAIARRAGIYEYRHFQFDAVSAEALTPAAGIEVRCEPKQQLMWLSDVRYRDQAALETFAASPDASVRAHLLGDIELLVDQSTTYRCVDAAARTLVDRTGAPVPQGPAAPGHFGVFFRKRSDEAALHRAVRSLAARWAALPSTLRIRAHLFEAPDMEAEKRGGYPIKTHAKELQYQAWIDLVMANAQAGGALPFAPDDASAIAAIHAYPVANVYTSVYAGRPTLVGLRGYPAYEAIQKFNAANQRQPGLLEWMYGPITKGGPAEPEAP
jgi:hypothetical protein